MARCRGWRPLGKWELQRFRCTAPIPWVALPRIPRRWSGRVGGRYFGRIPSGFQAVCPYASEADVTSAPLGSAVIPVSPSVLCVDVSYALHPFFAHTLASGHIHLMTIAQAFNYRVAVLRNGVWLAFRVGRSRKAEGCFLSEPNISWGHQVAVMFHDQILSTMALEVPAFLQFMYELQGECPNVQLYSEPWGHVDHSDDNCGCLSSDRTASYVLSLMPRDDVPVLDDETAPVSTEESGARFNRAYYLGVGRRGSVPFVSHRPGAYGRLLLAVYVRWKTALLVSSNWLRLVTRGGWRAGLPDSDRLRSDD